MLFTLISIFVPVGIYFALPRIIEVVTGKLTKSRTFLALACFCFFISWYLPSPLIEGKQTQFVTHFVGGGVFSGLLWLYIKNHIELKWNLLFDLVAIYILTSALGVASELFEFTTTQLQLTHLNPADTWWDLFANSLGAFSLWLMYCFSKLFRRWLR